MKNGNMIFASLCLVGACAPIASTAGGTGDEAFMARFRPDSASHLYPVGAKATVEASVTDKAGKARTEGVVEIWADDEWTNVVWRRTADLAKEPTVRMELSRQTPGSLRLWMRGNGFNVQRKPERIIFGVEDIVPLTQCPPDFEEYWRGELKRLDREVPIDVVKTPAPDLSAEDRDAFRVSFAMFGGKRVYGFLSVPKAPGRHPAIVNVPGAGPGVWLLHKGLIRPGYITLVMNVHDFPHCRSKEEQKKRFGEMLARLSAESGEPTYQRYGFASGRRDAPIYHDMMLGMARAVEWLANEPYADPSRFVYRGGSQGGGFGIYLTALWGKFAKSCIFCPNMCDMLAYKHGREPGSEHIKDQTPAHRPEAEKAAPYYDACNFARMITTPVRMTYGTMDDNCQTVGGIAAFNSITAKDKRLFLLPGFGHGSHTEGTGIDEWLFSP